MGFFKIFVVSPPRISKETSETAGVQKFGLLHVRIPHVKSRTFSGETWGNSSQCSNCSKWFLFKFQPPPRKKRPKDVVVVFVKRRITKKTLPKRPKRRRRDLFSCFFCWLKQAIQGIHGNPGILPKIVWHNFFNWVKYFHGFTFFLDVFQLP